MQIQNGHCMSKSHRDQSRGAGAVLGRYAIAAIKLALAALAGFAIFLVMARVGLLSGIETVFYRGVLLAGIAAIVLFVLLLLVNRARPWFSEEPVLAAVAITVSLSTAFLIVAPVKVDRSITVFLLGHMDRHAGTSFTPEQLQNEFEATYLGEWEQVSRRRRSKPTPAMCRKPHLANMQSRRRASARCVCSGWWPTCSAPIRALSGAHQRRRISEFSLRNVSIG